MDAREVTDRKVGRVFIVPYFGACVLEAQPIEWQLWHRIPPVDYPERRAGLGILTLTSAVVVELAERSVSNSRLTVRVHLHTSECPG